MYDSATPTALALRALERANLEASARRARLNQGYGLNDDGSLDNTAAGRLGSIYQTGLAGEQNYEQAASSDRARGFHSTGGLAGRGRARAQRGAIDSQAAALKDAFGNIAETRQQEQNNQSVYEDSLTQIRANSARDLAETLAANPVAIPASAPTPAPVANFNNPLANLFNGPMTPTKAAAQAAALKNNPRAAQTAKNNRY